MYLYPDVAIGYALVFVILAVFFLYIEPRMYRLDDKMKKYAFEHYFIDVHFTILAEALFEKYHSRIEDKTVIHQGMLHLIDCIHDQLKVDRKKVRYYKYLTKDSIDRIKKRQERWKTLLEDLYKIFPMRRPPAAAKRKFYQLR